MKRLLTPLLLAVALVGAPSLVPAADTPAAPAEKKAVAKGKFRPFNGKIKAVDKTAKTITLEGEKAQTFQIISETRLMKEGKPATLDDITVGEAVGGRARETADGKWEALTINAGTRAVRSPRPKPEEKKKQQ